MKARAVQVIPEGNGHGRFMPGEILEISQDLIKQYVLDGLAAWLIEDNSPTEKAQKRSRAKDEVKNGNR